MLVNWFESINEELTTRLKSNCGTYPHWQDTFNGSKKYFRRKVETLTLYLTLRQTKYTLPEAVSVPSVFTLWGNGNSTLLPSTTTSMLESPWASYDVPGEIERITPHVSGPLSIADTREETSVLPSGDLFRDFPTLHTYIGEE
jgi:hypothetical protein